MLHNMLHDSVVFAEGFSISRSMLHNIVRIC